MFSDCESLTSLDLSNFDTSNLTDTYDMFKDMKSLTTIYVGNKWDSSKITSSVDMFTHDTNLVGEAGTTYDDNHREVEYARVDDPQNGKPGYFTLKTT